MRTSPHKNTGTRVRTRVNHAQPHSHTHHHHRPPPTTHHPPPPTTHHPPPTTHHTPHTTHYTLRARTQTSMHARTPQICKNTRTHSWAAASAAASAPLCPPHALCTWTNNAHPFPCQMSRRTPMQLCSSGTTSFALRISAGSDCFTSRAMVAARTHGNARSAGASSSINKDGQYLSASPL